MGGLFRKTIDWISNVAGYVSSYAILVAALIVTYEVIFRYLYNRPTVWEIEAAVFLLIFASFIGAAYGLKSNSHIKVEFLTTMLKPKTRALWSTITDAVSFSFCVALSYHGWLMWWEVWKLGWRSETLWGPPLWIPYLFLPVGCTILSLQYLLRIGDSLREYQAMKKDTDVAQLTNK